jgi:putative redox protein
MTSLTDTRAPTSTGTIAAISAEDRATALTHAADAWGKRIAASDKAGQLTYRVSGEGEGAVASRIRAGKHTFLVDEPSPLAGNDVAASPVEYALGALISCQIVVYRLYAHGLGIQVDDIRVDAEADLDARRLFGIDDTVRAGFSDVRLTVTITGPESDERYQQLREAVDTHCPVHDLFANATPVSTVVRRA